MAWVEDRARALREQTGGDPERLAAALEPGVILFPTRGLACCIHLPREALAFAPYRDTRLEVHELAHGALTVGLGLRLLRLGVPTWRRQLIRDEAVACRFVQAFIDGLEE